MKYFVREGVVVRELSYGYVILLEDGNQVVSKNTPIPSLKVQDEVIVTWFSRDSSNKLPFDGYDYFVDNSAVELKNKWHRQQLYIRKPNRIGYVEAGHEYEAKVYRELLEYGYRIDRATDYEDEVLHVDIWWLIHISPGVWNWVAIDISMIYDQTGIQSKKYLSNLNRGIVTLNRMNSGYKYEMEVRDAVAKMEQLQIPLFSRAQGKALEEKYNLNPPENHNFKTLKLVLKPGA